jgi:hypothetical protein
LVIAKSYCTMGQIIMACRNDGPAQAGGASEISGLTGPLR